MLAAEPAILAACYGVARMPGHIQSLLRNQGGGSWDIPCLREEVVPVRVEIEWRSNDILGYYLS